MSYDRWLDPPDDPPNEEDFLSPNEEPTGRKVQFCSRHKRHYVTECDWCTAEIEDCYDRY